MKVLIVGGSGLVGAAVAAALSREHEVLALSRGGTAPVGVALAGDARVPHLGLDKQTAAQLRSSVTHIVSTMGSVSWRSGPRAALETHELGTRHLVEFAQTCTTLVRFVHISSVLVLGRAKGRLDGQELDVGQDFRNWYEYGKFLAESVIRSEEQLPWRIVRFGPILGPSGPVLPKIRHGLPAALPFLLRGYPAPMTKFGEFPCYVGDSMAAAEVVTRALTTDGHRDTWTWFDPLMPTLATVFTALCSAWGVVPRIVASPLVERVLRMVGDRMGVPPPLHEYNHPWFDLDPQVLNEIPGGPPGCPADYLEATGVALRAEGGSLWV